MACSRGEVDVPSVAFHVSIISVLFRMKVHSTIQLQANDGILLCQIPRMEMSFILLSGLLLTP